MSDNQENRWTILDPIRFDLKVEPEVREHRKSICESCDKLTIIKTCTECGCIMPLKTWLKSGVCPLNKWQ